MLNTTIYSHLFWCLDSVRNDQSMGEPNKPPIWILMFLPPNHKPVHIFSHFDGVFPGLQPEKTASTPGFSPSQAHLPTLGALPGAPGGTLRWAGPGDGPRAAWLGGSVFQVAYGRREMDETCWGFMVVYWGLYGFMNVDPLIHLKVFIDLYECRSFD